MRFVYVTTKQCSSLCRVYLGFPFRMDVEVHLESILDQLEDINFDSCSSRSKAYEYIKEVFDGKGCINVSSMDRLMAIIEKDLQKKDTTIVSALSVLMSIVKKVEVRLSFILFIIICSAGKG